MTLSILDWDDIGYPNEIEPIEICHTISHGYGGGYSASRPAAHKMQKLFNLVYRRMTADQWLNLIEFWRSVYGSANAFYFEFPISLYGSPSYGGSVIGEPADGFDTDYEVGFGCGAVFTCKFAEDRMPQKTTGEFENLWSTNVPILEVA